MSFSLLTLIRTGLVNSNNNIAQYLRPCLKKKKIKRIKDLSNYGVALKIAVDYSENVTNVGGNLYN